MRCNKNTVGMYYIGSFLLNIPKVPSCTQGANKICAELTTK